MIDERKVRVYVWLVKNGFKMLEEIPAEYQLPVAEYLATQAEGSRRKLTRQNRRFLF